VYSYKQISKVRGSNKGAKHCLFTRYGPGHIVFRCGKEDGIEVLSIADKQQKAKIRVERRVREGSRKALLPTTPACRTGFSFCWCVPPSWCAGRGWVSVIASGKPVNEFEIEKVIEKQNVCDHEGSCAVLVEETIACSRPMACVVAEIVSILHILVEICAARTQNRLCVGAHLFFAKVSANGVSAKCIGRSLCYRLFVPDPSLL